MPRRNSNVSVRIFRPQHESVERLEYILRTEWRRWRQQEEALAERRATDDAIDRFRRQYGTR